MIVSTCTCRRSRGKIETYLEPELLLERRLARCDLPAGKFRVSKRLSTAGRKVSADAPELRDLDAVDDAALARRPDELARPAAADPADDARRRNERVAGLGRVGRRVRLVDDAAASRLGRDRGVALEGRAGVDCERERNVNGDVNPSRGERGTGCSRETRAETMYICTSIKPGMTCCRKGQSWRASAVTWEGREARAQRKGERTHPGRVLVGEEEDGVDDGREEREAVGLDDRDDESANERVPAVVAGRGEARAQVVDPAQRGTSVLHYESSRGSERTARR